MWHNTTGEGDYKGVIGKRKDSRRLLSSMANFDGFQRHTIRGGGCSMISVVAMPRGKKAESQLVKYWKIIADNLSKAGWSSSDSRRPISASQAVCELLRIAKERLVIW